MLQETDVLVNEFSFAGPFSYGMTLVHRETGLSVTGNCKTEQFVPQLKLTLLNSLADIVGKTGYAPSAPKPDLGQHDLMAKMIAKMDAMQAELEALRAGKPPRKPQVRRKAAEKAAPAAEEVDEAELIRQQMRPPTDRPVDAPRKSGGGTVTMGALT